MLLLRLLDGLPRSQQGFFPLSLTSIDGLPGSQQGFFPLSLTSTFSFTWSSSTWSSPSAFVEEQKSSGAMKGMVPRCTVIGGGEGA